MIILSHIFILHLNQSNLRISINTPYFIKNRQIHNDMEVPLLQDWIKNQSQNCHSQSKHPKMPSTTN